MHTPFQKKQVRIFLRPVLAHVWHIFSINIIHLYLKFSQELHNPNFFYFFFKIVIIFFAKFRVKKTNHLNLLKLSKKKKKNEEGEQCRQFILF